MCYGSQARMRCAILGVLGLVAKEVDRMNEEIDEFDITESDVDGADAMHG